MKIKIKSVMLGLVLSSLFAALSVPAQATIITGELNIIGAVRVDSDDIDFLPAGGGDGQFIADPFTQEGYVVPAAGTLGRIKDLNVAFAPVGMPFVLPDFITLSALPGFSMTLEFFDPGVFSSALCGAPAAAGQSCTPPGSPFNLANATARSSTISFSVRGTATDGSGDPPSPFLGTFTTQFSNRNYQEVLAIIAGGNSVGASFSANFVFTAIPEPSTIALVLLGGVAIFAGSRRRLRSRG